MEEHMKRLLVSLIAFIFSITLFGCGSSSSSDNSTTDNTNTGTEASTKYVPTKLGIDVPNAIQGNKSSVSAIGQLIRTFKTTTGQQSQAAIAIKGYTEAMTSLEMMAGFFAIVGDAIIQQNPGIENAGDKLVSITLTQTMVDDVKKILGGNDAIDVSDLQECVGQTATLSVNYQTGKSGTYAYYLKVVDKDDDGSLETTTIEWNTERTKAKVTLDEPGDGETNHVEFTYDDTDKKMTLALKSDSIEFTISLQTKDSGAMVLCTFNNLGTEPSTFTLQGYADNNGGYMKGTFTQGTNIAKWDESFDADGLIISSDTYSNEYANGSSNISNEDINGTNAYIASVTIDSGDYLAYKNETLTSISSIDESMFIGSGSVNNKYIAIMPSSETMRSYLDNAGNTYYVYKMTWNEDGTCTLGSAIELKTVMQE